MPTPLLFDSTFRPAIQDSGGSLNDAVVSYNGFNFPPALRASASIDPVMDDANRVLKYIRLSIRIECFIFHGMNMGNSTNPAAPNITNNLQSGNYDRDDHKPKSVLGGGAADKANTTDLEMMYLRARLEEPGQRLVFQAQGIGTVKIGSSTGTQPDPDSNGFYRDVDNGPHPSVVTWKPLTNKIARVVWEITAAVPPCGAVTAYTLPGGTTGSVAQFPFRVSFGLDRRGLTTRTITGRIEIPLARKSSPSTSYAGEIPGYDFDAIRDVIVAAFPLLPRFHREQSYDISEDRKTVAFSLTDTEISSDEAYGEGIAHADVTITTSNPHRKVFSIWDVSLSGTYELMAGYPKHWALAEISRLFNHYYSTCSVRGNQVRHVGENAIEREEGGDQGENTAETSQTEEPNKSFAVMDTMSFTDSVYGRNVSFSLRWSLFTSLKTLFEATGMFVPIRTNDAAQQTAWDLWKTSLGLFLNDGGYQNLNFTHNDDVIVSLCQPWTQGEPSTPTLSTPVDPPTAESDGEPTPLPETADGEGDPGHEADIKLPTDAWLSYEPRFELEIIEHSNVHSPLGDFEPEDEIVLGPNRARNNARYYPPSTSNSAFQKDAAIPGPLYTENVDSSQQVLAHFRRQPTYLLHFSGVAIRLNYPVPEPQIQQCFGRTPRRVGRTIMKPRLIGTGVDVATGKSYQIHGLMWHKTYALPLPPASAKIKTDAHKDIYA